ncbi:MAG: hypothetical protein A3K19_13635 [Lentisphaerae bacterium RIFOXYB12_FULL_65_16]|nr:MAG: hypothetical protein A3K18_30990 [Lentisphaerae bacterium RIFOXYA12_64_32]OGV86047.1 MAG: hypothetical protein A3K19_13635 [Lentisphaerae bacterium RIFOXYB12_FULL_65_16]
MFRATTVSLVLLLACNGCVAPHYSVVLENATALWLRPARVTYEDYHSGNGGLGPRLIRKDGSCFASARLDEPIYAPIPELAVIEYKTDDGVLHRTVVEVGPVVKGKAINGGQLIFTIEDIDKVAVRFETDRDLREEADRQRQECKRYRERQEAAAPPVPVPGQGPPSTTPAKGSGQ